VPPLGLQGFYFWVLKMSRKWHQVAEQQNQSRLPIPAVYAVQPTLHRSPAGTGLVDFVSLQASNFRAPDRRLISTGAACTPAFAHAIEKE
jgi:hypothetical protein